MSEKEYLDKYGDLYNPDEQISEKLRKYNLNAVQRDLKEKHTPYVYFIAKARQSFNNSINVYKMNNDVLQAIRDTSIDKMPDITPHLYSQPFIIEAHEKDSVLFGDIDAIVGFYNDYEGLASNDLAPLKHFNLLFHTKKQNDPQWFDYILHLNQFILQNATNNFYMYLAANLFYLKPFENRGVWDFNFVDYNRKVANPKKYCNTCIDKEKCKGKERRSPNFKYHLCLDGLYDNILSFLTVFNYMLEAKNEPILADKRVEHSVYTATKKGKIIEKKQDWIVKYLYLNDERIKYEKNPEPSELDREGLTLKEVKVKSHLRHQACGEGHKDHEWIWIEGYYSTRWVREGDTKTIVGLKTET